MGQTDGQTDRNRTSISRVSVLTSDKKKATLHACRLHTCTGDGHKFTHRDCNFLIVFISTRGAEGTEAENTARARSASDTSRNIN